MNKKGLYVVLEGIDGSGTTTQITRVAKALLDENKYQDIVLTHEPWKNREIKRRLVEDRDAYSGAEEMAKLYIGDGVDHSQLVRVLREQGVLVLGDRARPSTLAYQQAQGLALDRLTQMHKNLGIEVPTLTFLLDLPAEVAFERMGKRIQKEKFEKRDFLEKVRRNYKELADLSMQENSQGEEFRRLFGPIKIINGDQEEKQVTEEIMSILIPLYDGWYDLKTN
jgi:dTMP kinase